MSILRTISGLGPRRKAIIYAKGLARSAPPTAVAAVALPASLYFGWRLRCLTDWAGYDLSAEHLCVMSIFAALVPLMARFIVFTASPQLNLVRRANPTIEKFILCSFVFCMTAVPLLLLNTSPSSAVQGMLARLRAERLVYSFATRAPYPEPSAARHGTQSNAAHSDFSLAYEQGSTASFEYPIPRGSFLAAEDHPPPKKTSRERKNTNTGAQANKPDSFAIVVNPDDSDVASQIERIDQIIAATEAWTKNGSGSQEALFGEIIRTWLTSIFSGLFATLAVFGFEHAWPRIPLAGRAVWRDLVRAGLFILRTAQLAARIAMHAPFSAWHILKSIPAALRTLASNALILVRGQAACFVSGTPAKIRGALALFFAIGPLTAMYRDKARRFLSAAHERIVSLGLGQPEELSHFERGALEEASPEPSISESAFEQCKKKKRL